MPQMYAMLAQWHARTYGAGLRSSQYAGRAARQILRRAFSFIYCSMVSTGHVGALAPTQRRVRSVSEAVFDPSTYKVTRPLP